MKYPSSIFFLLPSDVRSSVRSFLTSKECTKLIKSNMSNPRKKRATQSQGIKQFIHEMDVLSKSKTYVSIPKLYLVLFLLASFLALVKMEYQITLYLFLYLIIGYLCMEKKSNRYWQIQFLSSRTEESFIVIASFIYIFLVLLIGYHTTIFYVQSTGNYHLSLFLILQAVFFGPLFEEIFFRGYIFDISSLGFRNEIYREYSGIWVSSFLFAMIHLDYTKTTTFMGDFIVFILAGSALGVLRWYTRSLLYCTIVHMAFNLTMLLCACPNFQAHFFE